MMPHCVIEYAEELESIVDINSLMSEVYHGALDSTLFEPQQVKVRAIAYQHHFQAPTQLAFIHVTASILAGRNDEQKQFLASQILKRVKALINTNISITVDIRDLNAACYRKYVCE